MNDIARKGGLLVLAVVVIDLVSWQLGLIHNLTELLLVSTTAAVGVATVLTIFLPSGNKKTKIETGQYVENNRGQVIANQVNNTGDTITVAGDLVQPEIMQGDVVLGDKPTYFFNTSIIQQPNRPPVRLDLPPRPDPFRGRVAELAELQAALQPGKIVSICAAGGMGKTALSGEALWRLSESGTRPPPAFPDGVFFHTFYNQKSVEAAFEALARFFGEEPKPTPEAAARRALSGKRALLILDGAEDADRLERMVAIHGACGVLVATRDRAQIQGVGIELTVLGNSPALELLQDSAGEYAGATPEAKRICELVGYLPLALNLAGRYMCAHQQKAAEYLVFLERTPLAVLHLDERRHESARVLFERSLDALEVGAAQILALFGKLDYAPLDEAWLLEVFPDEAALRRGLDGLTRYGLLLRSGTSSQLAHALLHTYAREQLSPPEGAMMKLAGRWAVYVKEQTALGKQGFERLDLLRKHLRLTIEWLSEEGDWQALWDLAYPVRDYLDIHGYTSDLCELCELALATARRAGNRREQSVWLGNLGLAYRALGEPRKAIENHEQALAIARQRRDRRGEGADLGNLGGAYYSLGEPRRAIEYYEQALAIARQIGDRRGEGAHLGNLGLAYYSLGELPRAIDYYEQALAIARQKGDRSSEGIRLGNLGLAYAKRGELPKAIEYHEQALAIASQIGDRRGEGNHLGNLGSAYKDLGDPRKAIEYHEQALAIARQIGDRSGEEKQLNSLGLAYAALGDPRKAIEYYEQALAIARQIGDRRGEGNSLGNMGSAYKNMGELSKAIKYHEQALSIARQIVDCGGEGIHLNNLGLAYAARSDPRKAIEYHEQALTIARDIGDRRNEGNSLGNLGSAYADLGDPRKAIEYYDQALAIARQIGDRRMEAANLGNLGLAYADLGELPKAIDYYEEALAIARQIGDKRGEGNRLGNLGKASYSLGELPKAIDYFEQALGIARLVGDRRGEGIWLGNLGSVCSKLGNLSSAYYKQGEVPKAIDYFEQALAIAREIGNRGVEGNQLEYLGNAYFSQGEQGKAIEYYQQALMIYKEILPPDHPSIQRTHNNIEGAGSRLASPGGRGSGQRISGPDCTDPFVLSVGGVNLEIHETNERREK